MRVVFASVWSAVVGSNSIAGNCCFMGDSLCAVFFLMGVLSFGERVSLLFWKGSGVA